jgi:peptidoglycan/LPS O-acetylase OafA/YrhL
MSASTSKPARIDALDMTKGVLVVFMVIYHSLNYSTQFYLAFKFMAFLPPSFIIITGFLLSRVYLARYTANDFALHGRLLTRAAKLLILFTVLNVGAQLVRSQNYHGPSLGIAQFFSHWPDIYFRGAGRLVAFEILLPIAYLLLLAPLLLWATRLHRHVLPTLAVIALAGCAVLEHHGLLTSSTVFLIAVGILGMLIGRVSNAALDELARHTFLLVLAYAAYAIVGAQIGNGGQGALQQVIGATIALAIVYGGSVAVGSEGWVQRRLIRLGQYSLVAYIAQIAILQLYSHVLGRPDPVSFGLAAMFFVTLASTVLLVETIDWAQTQSKPIHVAYRVIMP